MIITKVKYCIASKTFPLKFYRYGNETDILDSDVLMSKESCEDELSTYAEPEEFHILEVKIIYEF